MNPRCPRDGPREPREASRTGTSVHSYVDEAIHRYIGTPIHRHDGTPVHGHIGTPDTPARRHTGARTHWYIYVPPQAAHCKLSSSSSNRTCSSSRTLLGRRPVWKKIALCEGVQQNAQIPKAWRSIFPKCANSPSVAKHLNKEAVRSNSSSSNGKYERYWQRRSCMWQESAVEETARWQN